MSNRTVNDILNGPLEFPSSDELDMLSKWVEESKGLEQAQRRARYSLFNYSVFIKDTKYNDMGDDWECKLLTGEHKDTVSNVLGMIKEIATSSTSFGTFNIKKVEFNLAREKMDRILQCLMYDE